MQSTTHDSALTSQRAARPEQPSVALCFKVPFEFRQWLKLQALQRQLTMTEFLTEATQGYARAHPAENGNT